MSAKELPQHEYRTARTEGTVTHQDGYHQPGGGVQSHTAHCGCSLDTGKGAYRDVTVELGGVTIHYYHQSPIVVESDGAYRLDSHGYRTSTTKERLNRYLPRGYKVIQRDYEWYVESWDPDAPYDEREPTREPFEDGMIVEP